MLHTKVTLEDLSGPQRNRQVTLNTTGGGDHCLGKRSQGPGISYRMELEVGCHVCPIRGETLVHGADPKLAGRSWPSVTLM